MDYKKIELKELIEKFYEIEGNYIFFRLGRNTYTEKVSNPIIFRNKEFRKFFLKNIESQVESDYFNEKQNEELEEE